MNIQLTNVLSDVVGESGQKILRAIVAGERDGHVLGAMKNVRVRASVDEIAKSLQGNWRAEHLFALKQALDAFDFVGTQLAECDTEIELQLQRLQVHDGEPAKGKKRGRARNAEPGHKASCGRLAPGEGPSLRLGAACKAPSSICARNCSGCAAWT
jgi:transposase